MRNLIKLTNGDLVNINDILYVHPSKTEEFAYLYIKQLYHSDGTHNSNIGPSSKMIKITLDDYDMICKSCIIEAPEENIMITE